MRLMAFRKRLVRIIKRGEIAMAATQFEVIETANNNNAVEPEA